eukprot:jgi/Chlat1/1647/Chrsp127S01899
MASMAAVAAAPLLLASTATPSICRAQQSRRRLSGSHGVVKPCFAGSTRTLGRTLLSRSARPVTHSVAVRCSTDPPPEPQQKLDASPPSTPPAAEDEYKPGFVGSAILIVLTVFLFGASLFTTLGRNFLPDLAEPAPIEEMQK